MKRIGIITINDYSNYGNRLQNYAVQEVLNSLNSNAVTIITKQKNSNKNQILTIPNHKVKKFQGYSITEIFNKVIRKVYSQLNKRRIDNAEKMKVEKFKTFSKKYINESDYIISLKYIPKDIDEQFDYFITGSDQVWNPTFDIFSELNFLTFASPVKRISYAASFGISEISSKYKDDFQQWINQMKHLSIREDAGADIIKNLTGREAQVLVDPTLMLDKGKWLSILNSAKYKPKSKYLATYFLGKTYDTYKIEIKKIARSNNLKIVNLNNIRDLKRFSADPAEFLDYINSCEIFLTDSFHGVIFSIIFNKPFIIFDRLGNLPSMNSRMDTLLSKFKFENRKWENIKDTNDFFNNDFSHVPEIIEVERNKTLNYLKNALDIKGEN